MKNKLMTEKEFKELLIRIEPKNKYAFDSSSVTVIVALSTCANLFIKNEKETKDIKMLRKMMQHLFDEGHLPYKD